MTVSLPPSIKYVERLGTLEDLDETLQMLLFTRILYPSSKLSSLEDAKRFIEQPKVDIHQVYRALSILSKESDNIQTYTRTDLTNHLLDSAGFRNDTQICHEEHHSQHHDFRE